MGSVMPQAPDDAFSSHPMRCISKAQTASMGRQKDREKYHRKSADGQLPLSAHKQLEREGDRERERGGAGVRDVCNCRRAVGTYKWNGQGIYLLFMPSSI